MTLNSSAILIVGVALLTAAFAHPAHCQWTDGSSRSILLRGGITLYETGSDDGCIEMGAPGVGASVRTGGRWFAEMSGEAYYAVGACDDDLRPHLLPDGRRYAERGAFFLLGPRLAIRGGHTVSFGPMLVDLSAGAGAAYSFAHGFEPGNRRISPWTGFTVGVSRGRRFGLEVQRGWQWVEIERVLEGANSPYERFRRAAPATEIFLTYRL